MKMYCSASPCDHIKVKGGKKSEIRSLPNEDVIDIIKKSYNKIPMGFFAYFLLYTGLRKAEALALTYNDIDYENKVIHVNKTLVFDGSKGFIKNHTKSKSGMRDVNILSVLYDKLPHGKKDDLLFPGIDGNYMTNSQYSRWWNKYLKNVGIDSLCAHQLRHAFATILYEAEIPDKDAQELMGHADIQTTRKIYTHISDKRHKVTIEKLEKYLKTV